MFASVLRRRPSTDRVLVRGDLHVRHVLLDPAMGEPSGVIDRGDPGGPALA